MPAVSDYAKDLAMAQDPNRWPVWPQLPLIKRDGSHEAGRLFNGSLSDDTVSPVVYLGLIYTPITTRTEKVEYESLEAVFADGWRVD